MEDVTKNYGKPGEPNDPQERHGTGHDGQPQPPEAKPLPPANITVSTAEDDFDPKHPLANVPTPKSGSDGPVKDADEHLLKPVIDSPNNRTGGG